MRLFAATLVVAFTLVFAASASAHDLTCDGARSAAGHSPAVGCSRINDTAVYLTYRYWALPDLVDLDHYVGPYGSHGHHIWVRHRGH